MVSIIINGSLETRDLLCAATRVGKIVRLLLTTAVKSGPLCNLFWGENFEYTSNAV